MTDLSERAIALIMYERTRAQALSLRAEMWADLFSLLYDKTDCWLLLAERERHVDLIICWEWLEREAKRYLKARGWEVLP